MKNNWPLGIILVMIGFMTFIIVLVVKTYSFKVDLVSEDYYKQELNYQTQLNKMNNVDTGNTVKWRVTENEIEFSYVGVVDSSISGDIEFFRPSDSSLDRKIKIAMDENGKQIIDRKSLADGYYRVKVDWLAGGENYFIEEDIYLK